MVLGEAFWALFWMKFQGFISFKFYWGEPVEAHGMETRNDQAG